VASCGDGAAAAGRGPRRVEELLADIGAAEGFSWLAAPGPAIDPSKDPIAHLEALFAAAEATDPFTVDARLRQVRRTVQRLDWELAGLLRLAVERRLYCQLGFASLEAYVESRLGICPRTAWSLLSIERATRRSCPLLGEAWRDGRVSSLAARVLLPVVGPRHGAAWIERAQAVTLRRLEAEVAWALDRLDARESVELPETPPLDHDLASSGLTGFTREELQMRSEADPPTAAAPNNTEAAVTGAAPDEATQASASASGEAAADTSTGAAAAAAYAPRVQIEFFAPESVVMLAEETMLALRVGSEPRGRAFERMLAVAMLEWMAAPAHRDPVFARDGWRCAVPGCSSRRNLHDHHVVFRSHGGDNDRDNRVAVCAAHHLHHLHGGRIRAHGRAPRDIVWEIGCRHGGGQPLARLLGDRYVAGGPRP